MEKTINSPSDFVRKSRLSNKQYQINGNELKFHPFGHKNGSMEAVITFTPSGAIGNYFGSKYKGIFCACNSVGVNYKTVRWINDNK